MDGMPLRFKLEEDGAGRGDGEGAEEGRGRGGEEGRVRGRGRGRGEKGEEQGRRERGIRIGECNVIRAPYVIANGWDQ